MKILVLLFVLVPLLELYFLIEVGSTVGVGTTILLVIFTAVLGSVFVRKQGFSTLNRVQTQLSHGRMPAREMVEGLVLLIAGVLLLTPGFFTDVIGFMLLIPPLRRYLMQKTLHRYGLFGVPGATVYEASPDDNIIEHKESDR